MYFRYLILAMSLSVLTGCEITDFSWGADEPESNQDGSVMENPFEEQMAAAPQKPNKSEIELGEGVTGQDMPEGDYWYSGQVGENNTVPNEPQYAPVEPEYTPVMRVPRNSYQPAYTHKSLSDYAEQMTMSLLQKTKFITPSSHIGVASFVEFNRDLQTTSVLGNRLAESFIAELQNYGLAIVDFKVMPSVKVTAEGDLFFHREGPRGYMQYVVTGTIHRSARGVEVNVRMINAFDQVVVASTRGFIPHFVVSSLTPDYMLLRER